MSRIFITGSADGLGLLTAKELIRLGHTVILHARNSHRAEDVRRKVPDGQDILIADLTDLSQTIKLADDLNAIGKVDVVVQNAGVYQASAEEIFAVNTIAPYVLTCLIKKPERLIYLSSGMHFHGRAKMEQIISNRKHITYSDSKFHVMMLCMTVARRWPDVYSNAVDPGWVPTKMGGKSAPDDLQKGYETQVWLSVSEDTKAKVTGKYFHHQSERPCSPEAINPALQEEFISLCEGITGIKFPQQ
jgi:NAD(P)-dependent dehydrogenase (short-subunit alcohol dehydrogenase family)